MKENYETFEISGHGYFCINCGAPISTQTYSCDNCGITDEEILKTDWSQKAKKDNTKSAYLIYYANQDYYEGQDVPFAIVESEERAKIICAEIIEFGNSLAAQMLYPHEDGISDEEYSLRSDKCGELRKTPFPYGWVCESWSDFEKDWSHEDGEPQKMKFDANTVAYKELPFL